MIENRRFYRIPFFAKILLGTADKVYSANCVNLSQGGVFISLLQVEEFRRDMPCYAVIGLGPNIPPITFESSVKRLALPSPNPEKLYGLGLAFDKGSQESRALLNDYLDDVKDNYELLGTLLGQGEPDIRSLRPIFSELFLPHFVDLAQLKTYVDRVLKSIEMIDQQQSSLQQNNASS